MYKLKKEGLVNELSAYFVTHQAMESYPLVAGNFGDVDDYSGEVDSSALIKSLVFEEAVTGERNALSMFSVGEHVFERDQLNTGANGTVLGLRRRNMDPNESRAVLRIASKTSGSQVPVGSGGGFGHHGGNIAWQGTTFDGVNDEEMGFLGFHWHTVANGNMLAEFWMGVNGDNTAFLMRANNDNILFDELGTGVNVGIGTTSPTSPAGFGTVLEIQGASTSVVFDSTNLSSGGGLEVVGNQPLRFFTNGSERMRILGGGNVGIGTNSPGAELEVNGDIYLATGGALANAGAPTGTNFKLTSTGVVDINSLGGVRVNLDTNNNSAASASFDIYSNAEDGAGGHLFTVLENGDVGVGTSSVTGKLQVSGGDVYVPRNNGNGFRTGNYGWYMETPGVTGGVGGGITMISSNGLVDPGAGEWQFVSNAHNGRATALTLGLGIMRVYADTGGSAGASLDWDEVFRVQYDSKVSIGNPGTPNTELHLHNPNSNNAAISITHTGTGTGAADGARIDITSGLDMRVANFESGDLIFMTSLSNRWRVKAAGGIVAEGLTHQGNGTINANAVYDNGSLLTDWVFDLWFDGEADDAELTGTERLWGIEETRQFAEKNRHLPAMPGRDEWEENKSSLGELVNGLWETVEQQAIHIFGLNERITRLEEKLA